MQTNSTTFRQASEVSGLEDAGGFPTQYCNYSLPNATSSLVTLERVIQVVRAGTKRIPFIAPITPEWAFNLLAPFVASESCALQLPFQRIPKLKISSRNGTTVNFTWDHVPAES
jgi:hypothetical protein